MQTVQTASKTRGTGDANGATVHSIGIAAVKVVKKPERIRTVLGSCIGVAVYDSVAGIGGMAHVILPDSTEGSGDPGKFADTAVDMLIEKLIEAGSVHKRLAAKIVGGAQMFGNKVCSGLGQRNAEAVKARLNHHTVQLVASAVGGGKGRKMQLDPATGEVHVAIIGQELEVL
ncbi:MAG: chemotaxis protein CheD [Phycisphaerae bacterium]